MKRKGLILFAITVAYNLATVMFVQKFKPTVILGIGLLFIWFIYGLWAKEGFGNGIVIGGIGASGVIGSILLGTTPLQIISFTLWGYPFWYSLIDITNFNQRFSLSGGLVTITVTSTFLLSIFIVALGSWIGSRGSMHFPHDV